MEFDSLLSVYNAIRKGRIGFDDFQVFISDLCINENKKGMEAAFNNIALENKENETSDTQILNDIKVILNDIKEIIGAKYEVQNNGNRD